MDFPLLCVMTPRGRPCAQKNHPPWTAIAPKAASQQHLVQAVCQVLQCHLAIMRSVIRLLGENDLDIFEY